MENSNSLRLFNWSIESLLQYQAPSQWTADLVTIQGFPAFLK